MKPQFIHKDLAAGRWFELSLMEQLANIGSEVSRARRAQYRDQNCFRGAAYRALDLFDLTLEDSRWLGRQQEIARTREIFCDTAFGDNQYKTSLEDLDKYFMPFAIATSIKR